MKKSHSGLSKNEPVSMCKECWCVGLVQVGRRGILCVRVGELSEIP